MSDSWSDIEVELIVADYFSMLEKELGGNQINKTEHRKKILPLLKGRSEGSIEFKHQNISAVLVELRQPFIRGYKPRFNYQKILVEKVVNYLQSNLSFEKNFEHFAEVAPLEKKTIIFENFIGEAPEKQQIAAEKELTYRRPMKINYLEREQNNRNLGMMGEEIVINYEKWRLIKLGKEKLSEQIEWVSKDQGDGLGFDILSKNENGTDRYIEVKTTKLTKDTPIFLSKNELDFSQEKSENFHLYRLFNFSEDPKMFTKQGSFDSFCRVEPIQFRGLF